MSNDSNINLENACSFDANNNYSNFKNIGQPGDSQISGNIDSNKNHIQAFSFMDPCVKNSNTQNSLMQQPGEKQSSDRIQPKQPQREKEDGIIMMAKGNVSKKNGKTSLLPFMKAPND